MCLLLCVVVLEFQLVLCSVLCGIMMVSNAYLGVVIIIICRYLLFCPYVAQYGASVITGIPRAYQMFYTATEIPVHLPYSKLLIQNG